MRVGVAVEIFEYSMPGGMYKLMKEEVREN